MILINKLARQNITANEFFEIIVHTYLRWIFRALFLPIDTIKRDCR